MIIIIKNLTGKTISLDVNPSDNIKVVKEKIYEKEGILPFQQRLIYAAKELEDSFPLSHYYINEKSILFLIVLNKLEDKNIYAKTLSGKTISL